jgi:hypothetical protein
MKQWRLRRAGAHEIGNVFTLGPLTSKAAGW